MKALRLVFSISVAASAASAATSKTPPLFVYEEGGDTISFFSPKTVRIVHHATDAGAHACQYDLPDNGNMVSGPEVENAFRASTVQAELHARHGYTSSDTGKLTAGADTLEWSASCRTNCAPEPAAVQQLHTTLRTVMRNARLVCP